ncbi:imidazole glycerol phosphate synthase subunit HisF [Candidatus Vidania fulgoroideorum]
MLYKRIIPCLDIIGNYVVKGTKFKKIKKVGYAVDLAKLYCSQGADEIIVLNIDKGNINTFSKLISNISRNIDIPLTAGGNINCLSDAIKMFKSGADRISLNSSLFKKNLIRKISNKYGSQSTLASIDVKKEKKKWLVFIKGGKINTNIEALFWIKKCIYQGVGEILLTSIDRDGLNKGYDIKLINYILNNINVPLICSGGSNGIKSIKDVLNKTNINSVLLASSLHSNYQNLSTIKKKLSKMYKIR